MGLGPFIFIQINKMTITIKNSDTQMKDSEFKSDHNVQPRIFDILTV